MLLSSTTALGGLLLMVASARAGDSDGLYTKYCSSQNTGSGSTPQYNIYNSMGSCYTHCLGSYAFAILQDVDCWCSNYAPAQQVSTSDCNEACPGYPSDQCGNKDQGLFGYIALNKAPLGTQGAKPTKSPTPTPTAIEVSEISTQTLRQTVQQTVTQVVRPSPSVVVSYVTPSSFVPSSSSSATSSKKKTTSSPGTESVSGSPTTRTVTMTPIPASPGSDKPTMHHKGLSSGAIAGAVIGSLIGVAAIAIAAFLLWRRRRDDDAEGGGSPIRSPKRKGSVLSKTGLLGGARPQSMSEANYDDPFNPPESTNLSNSVRHSMMFGAGAAGEGVDTAGPLGGGGSQSSGDSRRASRPFVYDQRLNPSALFANHDNGSWVSIQDQQDYSRPLGVANPDFRYSFDSR